MFRSIGTARKQVELLLDGEPVMVPAGISLAAAILSLGELSFRRSVVTESVRAPFCMMGICFECLVEIDGVANQRACQVEVKAGMQVSICRGSALEES